MSGTFTEALSNMTDDMVRDHLPGSTCKATSNALDMRWTAKKAGTNTTVRPYLGPDAHIGQDDELALRVCLLDIRFQCLQKQCTTHGCVADFDMC
jgi:hypothetical protein